MRSFQLWFVALACSVAAACGSSFGVVPDGGGAGTTGNGGAGGGGGGQSPCVLDTTYQYGNTGGLVAYEDLVTLTPASAYHYNRTSRLTDPPDISCAPAIPACGDSAAIDVGDVMAAIHDPMVLAALSDPVTPNGTVMFGRDYRPVDGSVFRFARVGGYEFLVGAPCTPNDGIQGLPCVAAIPDGVMRLMTTLRALDEQQLHDTSCAALR
jgi:hypothetical protein